LSETRPGRNLCLLWLDDLLALGVLAVLVGTLLSLLGRFWWVADLASHFAVYYTLAGGGLLIVAVLMRRRVRSGLALGVLIVNGVLVWPVFVPTSTPVVPGQPVLKMALINVLHKNRDSARVREFLNGCDADLVIVQEVDPWWDRVLRDMDTPYRVAESRPGEGSFGMSLLVREALGDGSDVMLQDVRILEFADGFEGEERPAIQATLLLGGRRIQLLGIHPPPPVSARHTALRDAVLRRAKQWSKEQTDPHIVIGDLNTTPWSYAFSILTGDGELISTQNGWGNQGTWPTRLPMPLLLPIDHCLTSGEWVCLDRWIGPPTGSDHLPLLVILALRPAPPAQGQPQIAAPASGAAIAIPDDSSGSLPMPGEELPAEPATIP
jgi:endonuclease/exonuclease/phosphatase (EEP) superfamily protein YafD